ncbi:MAG: SGNH/GDSL hydrolase family protein [Verrucomicrobiales bacterium]|nr:SGNH/GDSL hydrolase family protein [Verrucomicrobiales bacterium]
MKVIPSVSIAVFLTLAFSSFSLAKEEDWIRILLLGDSTTEGSVPRRLKPEGPHLEHVVRHLLHTDPEIPRCKVYNEGVSGEYIHRLLESGRYERDVASMEKLDYIFIRYGINDNAKRENFEKNFPADFHLLLSRLREDHPDALLIPTTVIPFSNEEVSAKINKLVRQVAEKEKLEVFDLYPRYAAELEKGYHMLNYRRYPLEKIPKQHHEWLAPRVTGGRVEVMDNELDALFGHLPGWFGDRHPNLAGYNVIADETAKYLTPILKKRLAKK